MNNAQLSTTDLIQSNEQITNEIYLSTIGRFAFSFSEGQKNTLYNIAIQCPLSGGNSVFKARAMLAILNSGLNYNDFDICNSVGIALRPQSKPTDHSKIRIYPNPANHNATLLYNIDGIEDALFSITNSYGQLVEQHKLNVNNISFTFSTSNLNPGVYFCTINNKGISIENSKLVIIH